MTSRTRWIVLALFVGIAIGATGPIRNYDLFWHLATGRWIVEHRALPQTDPFAVASDRTDWINGEWLFEIGAYAVERAAGIEAFSWLRGLFAATLFTLVWLVARREAGEDGALLLTVIAFAGAIRTLDMRPSGLAALFVVLALVVRGPLGHALLAVVWVNVHPSALLAPLIAAVREGGARWPAREGRQPSSRVPPFLASAAGLLVNPHGLKGVAAPLRLMSWAGSGAFVNAEWLPSAPRTFPLLYLCIGIAALILFAVRAPRENWWRMLLVAGLAILAVRHLRNQALFFAALPIVVAPALRVVPIPRRVATAAAGVALALLALFADHRLGVAAERFPLDAVARLKETRLAGNIYDPDQFGGFLIWSFYPVRRTLTDGRNELFRSFIPEYARARGDERAWRSLLERYRIDLAVDEYREPLTVIDAVTRKTSLLPASLAYWPRSDWALLAADDVAMVFARRRAFPPEVIARWELKGPAPDGPKVN